MSHTAQLSVALLFSLILLTACTDGEQMRRDLATLQTRNEADSLLTDSVQALTLTDYFDRHGTDNERLLAHYLLARTWTDLGQSPRALEEYHNAAGQADTTRLDSLGHHWLSRIYGQMGELLYFNQLPYNALEAYQYAYQHASQAHEPLAATSFYAQKYKCYYHLDQQEKALQLADSIRHRFQLLGNTAYANTYAGPLAYMYMRKGDYQKARQLLELYEYHSLLNETALQHNENWKQLYIYKGHYFKGVQLYDSALFYFNKTVLVSKSPNNKALSFQGLYQTYDLLNQKDSARKYAILYAEMNDSISKRSTSSALISTHHLYSYNHIRALAQQKTIEAKNANYHSVILALFTLFILSGMLVGYLQIRSRNKLVLQRIIAKYANDITMYAKIKNELQNQLNLSEEARNELKEKLQTIRRDIEKLQTEKLQTEQWKKAEHLFALPIVGELHQLAAQGQRMSDIDWKRLQKACNKYLPSFMAILNSNGKKLDYTEIQICVLLKTQFILSEISVLIDISSTSLSHKRKRMNMKFFGKDGSATDFDKRINAIE